MQHHVRDLLDGLVIPGTTDTIEAFITPPTVDNLDGPKAYIWGSRMRATRQTMPRTFGFKKLLWQVDVYLSYETVPDSPTVDQEFPLVIDAVMAALWSATMPTMITDPTTGL